MARKIKGATEGATGCDFPKCSTIFQNNFIVLSENINLGKRIKCR
nr:MAG TPA: hypothetical protein [Caudoviricetes sp.]